jgi:hypothetical protein
MQLPQVTPSRWDADTIKRFVDRGALLSSWARFGVLSPFMQGCILTDFVTAVQSEAARGALLEPGTPPLALCFVMERAAASLVDLGDAKWATAHMQHSALRCCASMLCSMACWPVDTLEQSWSTASLLLSKIMSFKTILAWASTDLTDALVLLAGALRILTKQCVAPPPAVPATATASVPFARVTTLALALRLAMELRTVCSAVQYNLDGTTTSYPLEDVIADAVEPGPLAALFSRVDWAAVAAVDTNHASYVASQVLAAASVAHVANVRDTDWLVAVSRVVLPHLDTALHQVVNVEEFSPGAVSALHETLKNCAAVANWSLNKDPAGHAARRLCSEWRCLVWFFGELVTAKATFGNVVAAGSHFKHVEVVVTWLFAYMDSVVTPPRRCTEDDLTHLVPGAKPVWGLDTELSEGGDTAVLTMAKALLASRR